MSLDEANPEVPVAPPPQTEEASPESKPRRSRSSRTSDPANVSFSAEEEEEHSGEGHPHHHHHHHPGAGPHPHHIHHRKSIAPESLGDEIPASIAASQQRRKSRKYSMKIIPPQFIKRGGSGGPKLVKKMIDILTPKREPLPVDLPPIGDLRRGDFVVQRKSTTEEGQAVDRPTPKGVVPFIEGDDQQNPFYYPESIEDFLTSFEAEQQKARQDMENVSPLMKGTNHFKQNQIVLGRIKPFLQPSFKPSLAHDYKQIVWKAQNGLHINHLQRVSRKLHTEYIMQRKQVYYMRRAIKARKIALEMIAKTREFEEACLKDYEWLTGFTKEAFEAFLKESDEQTHEAAKMAEQVLKGKLDKTLEVRHLSIQINHMKTEIIGINESLRECKSYMRFLDDIAREIMRKDEEEEIRSHHREQQVKEELMTLLKEGMSLRAAIALLEEKTKEIYREDADAEAPVVSGAAAGSVDFLAKLHREVRRHLGMPEERVEVVDTAAQPQPGYRRRKTSFDDDDDEPVVEEKLSQEFPTPSDILASLVQRNKSRLVTVVEEAERPAFEAQLAITDTVHKNVAIKEDADGFNESVLLASLDLVPGNEESDRRELATLSFTRPSQLLQIYSDMEETNLSLIQHSQSSEELLERVNQQIMHTRKQLNKRGRLLREEINKMQTNIDANEERANALAMLVEMFTGGNYDVRQQQKLYRILQHHIAKVYKAAVGSIDHHLNPIMMLTSIEKNFEDLMGEIQGMPTEVVVQISRELDKERREMERQEKMNARKAIQEERKSRQHDRAEAPVIRRKGRPLLARSHPPKMVIELSQAELDRKAEQDEYDYFFGP